MTAPARDTWLGTIEDVPLRPPATVRALGPTLVVAPHPDDEALGCGGTIALLQEAQIPVRVVIVSDGAASHPESRRYPAPALRALRRFESLAGLARLGVSPSQVTFLDLPDGAVPTASSAAGQVVVQRARALLRAWSDLRTVLVPWRRDPHDDHRATWSLMTAALDEIPAVIRCLEYPIWTLVHPAPSDPPRPDEVQLWRLDIGPVLDRKRAAILAHRSQTTDLIDDDPTGYCLTDAVLAHFFRPWELFMEMSA